MTDAGDPRGFIRIEGVSKSFGRVTALAEVDFDIARGEFFSLLGPSGCGKTTLLRILAGIEAPGAGRVVIEGQDMTRVPPNRRPTNMVFQSYAVFPHLDVAGNVGYGLRYQGLGGAEARARVEAALALVKLDGLGARGANELSGGQRQRVALARALVLRPKVLLLDEPLSALDRQLREEMQIELRALQREVGITFVFVTHDQDEAMALSDRVAVMDGGRIRQIDTPEALYDRPADLVVAGFIGAMALFPGRLLAAEGAVARVDCGAAGCIEAEAPSLLLAPGTAVVVAVRPERLRIGPPGQGSLPGRVRSVAFLGDRRQVMVAVEGLERPAMVIQPADPTRPRPRTGDAVSLSWSAGAARVLPVTEQS